MIEKPSQKRPKAITEDFIQGVCERLRANKPVDRRLPVWGKIHIDRQLPFLIVYRRPIEGHDEGTERLVVGEASYLLASGDRRLRSGISNLVLQVGHEMAKVFGAFLVVEVWTDTENGLATRMEAVPAPSFRIFHRASIEFAENDPKLRRSTSRYSGSPQSGYR